MIPIFCVLCVIAVLLALRDFIDNRALSACANELKRIADALAAPPPEDRAAPAISGLVAEVKRIANVAERREEYR